MPGKRPQCRNHPVREAAARCVSCGQHFCRECVTPLERRMFCSVCFKAKTEVVTKKKRDWFLLTASMQLVAGIMILWFTVYMVGRILVQLPSSFHEGTVWEKAMER